ncbi:MAG: PaaI family thioesterase [Terricaulis sp.]
MALTGLQIVEAFKNAQFSRPLPPWIEHMRVHEENILAIAEVGRVVSVWTPGPQFTLPDGYVQGGLICALADGGQALAITTTLEAYAPWVTMDLQARYARPFKSGERITIESRVLNIGKTSAIVETTFMLASGKLAVKVTGGWRKSDTR